jgi:hypothetical protein
MMLRILAAIIAVGFALAAAPAPAPLATRAAAQVESKDAKAAQADKASPQLPTLEERRRRLGAIGGEDLALPEAPDPMGLSEQTAQAFQDTLRAYYAYRLQGYDHRQRVFEWQFLSSKIIFVVVNILVFAGIYFAAIQFHAGLRRRETVRDGAAAGETTEVDLSFKGVKVRSPVLGVIVLTLSLAFFYLYLVYVYPIENIF